MSNNKKASYRAFVFDDDQNIRAMLWEILDQRGYEVFTFPDPGYCPLFEMAACPCPLKQSCTDIIITDLNMPVSNGLDFIETQLKKGCHCKHIALISGDLNAEALSKANKMGLKIFEKPFGLDELTEWLDKVEKK